MKTSSLPLVEYMSSIFVNVRLDNTLVIACQHILPTNYPMFNLLFDKGLKPENTFILGKCYSTEPNTLKLFIRRGVKIPKFSNYFDSHKSFDKEYEDHVRKFFLSIINKKNLNNYKKIILIDDGGFLIETAHKLLKNFKKLVGVEQTSSGYEKIKNINLKFPVINVARSQTKLKYESPIIARQFIRNFNYELKKLNRFPKSILLLGYGIIGKAIKNKLKKKYLIKIYDPLSDKSDFKSFESLKERVNKFDVIIGCTGRNSMPVSFYGSLKKGAILVSSSSSDREFDAPHLRMLIERYTNCHDNARIRDIILLNSGFPLTFTKYSWGAEGKRIQLTRALIFSAVCLSQDKEYSSRVIELDLVVQKIILDKFLELNLGKAKSERTSRNY